MDRFAFPFRKFCFMAAAMCMTNAPLYFIVYRVWISKGFADLTDILRFCSSREFVRLSCSFFFLSLPFITKQFNFFLLLKINLGRIGGLVGKTS